MGLVYLQKIAPLLRFCRNFAGAAHGLRSIVHLAPPIDAASALKGCSAIEQPAVARHRPAAGCLKG
jgi:hypothetical protein